MEILDYVDCIKDQLTGFGILESELDDDAYKRIVNMCVKELNRYYNLTELVEVEADTCIDLKKYPDISTVTAVYRTEGVGFSTDTNDGKSDPIFMSQMQMFNFGSSYYNSNWVYNYGAFSSAQRIANTISTDLAFKEVSSEQKLYINFSQGRPDLITIEYIPRLKDASQVKGDYWQDMLLRLSLAQAKIAVGRARTRFTQSSALWTDDGASILDEGRTELADLRERLRVSEDLFLPID